MIPKVTLISYTNDPIGTIFKIWEASKSNRNWQEIEDDVNCCEDPSTSCGNGCNLKRQSIFEKVIDSKIPVAENLNFVFLLEGVSISFREQMVRHRIGVNVGDRLGVDIVPDLADSTWWSQSMRILDMSNFAKEGAYRVPKFPNPEAETVYRSAMKLAEVAYGGLVAAGMSMEDAREVIPLGATHRITWGLNLAALQHIVGKRGCQILQGDLWEPIIQGMVEELAKNVDPYFRRLIAPPCISGWKYVGCKFKLDNERRVEGKDEIPPCTLYAGKELPPEHVKELEKIPRFSKMAEQYKRLWGKNPFTFEA